MARKTKGSCDKRDARAHATRARMNLGNRFGAFLLLCNATQRHRGIPNANSIYQTRAPNHHQQAMPTTTFLHPCRLALSAADSTCTQHVEVQSSCCDHPPAPAAPNTAATRRYIPSRSRPSFASSRGASHWRFAAAHGGPQRCLPAPSSPCTRWTCTRWARRQGLRYRGSST